MDVHVDRTTKLMEAMVDRHCAIENTVKQADGKQEAVLRRLELLEGNSLIPNFPFLAPKPPTVTAGGNGLPSWWVDGTQTMRTPCAWSSNTFETSTQT
eukprot:s4305_g5.t1